MSERRVESLCTKTAPTSSNVSPDSFGDKGLRELLTFVLKELRVRGKLAEVLLRF